MQEVDCDRCQATLPRSESWTVLGSTVCESCGNELIGAHQEPLAAGEVQKNVDATLCHCCQHDTGEEWPLLCGVPTCPACDARMRNYPYPTWIKVSFVALVALGIASFLYNYRFADALFASRRANKAWAAGDVDRAADQMERAAKLVPEVADFRLGADLFRGIQLVRDDRPKEALPLLVRVQQADPDEPMLRTLLLQTELSAAFDDKQYDVMVLKALALAEAQPDNRTGKYAVASAYACRWAETGDKAFKEKALEALAEAEKIGGGDDNPAVVAAYASFRQRILFRLATREIITTKQFEERFPNGWQEAEQAP
jgi:hypothetical protein